jgi:RNase H-like domain found in reverse transcriptase
MKVDIKDRKKLSDMPNTDIFNANILKVCCFLSHILSSGERNYSTIKKKLYLIVKGLLLFCPIIQSSNETVWTLCNHRNMELYTRFNIRRRRHNWSHTTTRCFNYVLAYVKGEKNEKVYYLSRRGQEETSEKWKLEINLSVNIFRAFMINSNHCYRLV